LTISGFIIGKRSFVDQIAFIHILLYEWDILAIIKIIETVKTVL